MGTLIFVVLTACSTHLAMRKQLDESITKYNKLLSIQSFDAAGFFAAETIAKEFSARTKAAKNIKVVDHRIVRVKYEEETGKAEVEVEIQYYTISSYQLKTLLDIQKWAYITGNSTKQWRLISLLPEFP